MAQSQIQELKQEQKLQQAISAQQLLLSQLVELPISQLEERIETEMHDNPALEATDEGPDYPEYQDHSENTESAPDDFDSQREREERNDALDAALENVRSLCMASLALSMTY